MARILLYLRGGLRMGEKVKNTEGSLSALFSAAAGHVAGGVPDAGKILEPRMEALGKIVAVDVDAAVIAGTVSDLSHLLGRFKTAVQDGLGVFREPEYFTKSGLDAEDECDIDPCLPENHVGYCRLAADLANAFAPGTLSNDDWEELSGSNSTFNRVV